MKATRAGFTLVETLIVVGIIATIAAIAIPGILRARTSSNETAAQMNLRAISTALENYSSMTEGKFPAIINDLYSASPPYLNKDYFAGPVDGFTIAVTDLRNYSYLISANPTSANQGTRSFTVSTGGVLTKN